MGISNLVSRYASNTFVNCDFEPIDRDDLLEWAFRGSRQFWDTEDAREQSVNEVSKPALFEDNQSSKGAASGVFKPDATVNKTIVR
jgi:hypothetical protein